MPAAFLDGAHDAAYALAWLCGALSVAVLVVLVVLGLTYVLEPAYRRTGARLTRWRYTRLHARSGRTTGPQ